MEFNEVVQSRRSIRKYKDKPVAKELIEKMIASAILAPSWKNYQTSRYHVAMSPDIVEAIKQQSLALFNAVNCEDAPVLIISTFVKDRSGFERNGEPSNELGNAWGSYDLGLHNENLLLKANELGLSSLVIGIRDANKIRELMHIDKNEIIVAVISIGYADIAPIIPRRKTVEEITTFY